MSAESCRGFVNYSVSKHRQDKLFIMNIIIIMATAIIIFAIIIISNIP